MDNILQKGERVKKGIVFFLFAIAVLISSVAWAEVLEIGKPAPDFSLKNIKDKRIRLSDYRGHFVVLEWIDAECPFVLKHYRSGNIPRLQRKYMADGNTVWLSIVSFKEGKEGNYKPGEVRDLIVRYGAIPTEILLDRGGRIAQKYHVTKTPTFFILNPAGILLYAGAIDSVPSQDPYDIRFARNYIDAVLSSAMKGESISITSTMAYGCPILP